MAAQASDFRGLGSDRAHGIDLALDFLRYHMGTSTRGSRDLERATFNYVVGRGFGVVELVVVALIVAALAGEATRAYEGYAQLARTVEGKMLAAALWTAIHTRATTSCGKAVVVSTVFPKAGLDASGVSESARWAVSGGAFNAITVDCATGAISPNGEIFAIRGQAGDISALGVKLTYAAAAAPPAQLHCTLDGGTSFTEC
jgi:Tfp pilus assembly protein PilE